MLTSDIQSPFIDHKDIFIPTSAFAGEIRSYSTVFLDDILESNFYAYYRSQLNSLVDYYQNKQITLTSDQEAPLENILELL